MALICSKCKSLGLKMLSHEELSGHRFREKYECENCGAKGTKIVDDDPELQRPEISHRGNIEWRKEK